MFRAVVAATVALAALASPALAQRGDRPGHDMKEIWRDMDVPPAPVVEPEDALDTFRIAPGFRLELVAAEPLVEDPVAMTFDAQGRIWVVEMRGFMPNIDGEGEDEPVGRVVVLEDTDGDGRMDKSTVFLDELVMPRAIAIVGDGVLVSEPPNLWLCKDTDGDLQADEKHRVADYAQQGPVEHTDNRLLRNLDNWIYNAKSSKRMKFVDGELITEDTHFRGQWGMAQDNYGRLYYNHNSHYLFADYFPDAYLRRNSAWPHSHGINANIVDTREVFTIRVNPGVNRAYMDGQLREDGRLRTVTGISDAVIYRGDQFGESFVGDAFIPEPTGNAVAHFDVQQEGVEIVAKHQTYDDPEWEKREFLASTDERFRPVSIYNGPDGAVYIVDLYRGILQHKVYVTTYLRNYVLEQGLDKPVGLGRIYRVVREDEPVRREPVDLASASTPELVAALSHDSGWHRDTAQRLLVERDDSEAVRPLRSLAQNGRTPLGRIHAIWTLEGMDSLDLATVHAAVSDPEPQVRISALRATKSLLDSPRTTARIASRLLPEVLSLAEDGDTAVRVQAAFTLGEFVSRDDRAEQTLAEMLAAEPGNPYIRQAVISGLARRELEMLQRLLEHESLAERSDGADAVLLDLAQTIFHAGRAPDVVKLLEIAAAEDDWPSAALVTGMARAAEQRQSPIALPGHPDALQVIRETHADAAEQIAGALELPDAEMAEAEEVVELTPEQEALKQRGQTMYLGLCMACHQIEGQGQSGMAPPLVDSEHVLGEPEKLIALVLDSGAGISTSGKKWQMVMPPMRENPALDDETIAGLLTFIRRSWGHEATPIDPETVEKVREATADRGEPWTREELEALEINLD